MCRVCRSCTANNIRANYPVLFHLLIHESLPFQLEQKGAHFCLMCFCSLVVLAKIFARSLTKCWSSEDLKAWHTGHGAVILSRVHLLGKGHVSKCFNRKSFSHRSKRLHRVPTEAASLPIIFCRHPYSVVSPSHFTPAFETLKPWKWTRASWTVLQAALQAVACVCVDSTKRAVKVVEPEVQWKWWPLFPATFLKYQCIFWVNALGQWFSTVGCVLNETNRQQAFSFFSQLMTWQQWPHQKWLIDFTYR